MEFFNLKTKYFDFTFRKLKNAYLTIALLFLTGGIGSLTQSFWLQLFKKVHKDNQKQIDTSSYVIGISFLFIGFYYVYFFYKSKRNLIYAEIFERISLLKNEILEMIHLQQLQFNESVAEATQLKAYNYYKKTIIFIEMNKLVTDKNIYNQIWDLTQNFGTEILFFQGYIHNMKKYIAKEPAALKDYSPTKKMDETAKNFKKLSEDYKNISEVLANKVWWLTQD